MPENIGPPASSGELLAFSFLWGEGGFRLKPTIKRRAPLFSLFSWPVEAIFGSRRSEGPRPHNQFFFCAFFGGDI